MFDWSSARPVEEEEEEDFIPLEEELEEKREEEEEEREEEKFDWASATVQGSSSREDIMAELDDDPDTRMLAYQMLDTEGGGVATMEALVNRTAMIRQKIPDWTIGKELNSGFYGPINRGYAQTLNLDPKTMARYQQDIDEVRAGSNRIQGRTDQGSGRDPNVGGPGRVHIPDNPNEVYNYWTGRRNGVEFSHEDSAAFAAQMEDTGRASTTRTAKAGEKYPEFDWASAKPVEEEQVAEFDWASAKPVEPGQLKEEKGGGLTPNQTRTATNRNRLSSAIADVEKAGYTVPHFIGTENEPEGDRAPTRDMESLAKALALQEENAIRAGNTTEAAKIRQERAYWEDHIAKYGMTAEQWKKQTGEEDPRYPHEPAFTAKQSPEELIESVDTAITAGQGTWETAKTELAKVGGALKTGVQSAGLGLGETINRYAYSPIVHGLREAIDYIAPDSDLAKHAAKFDDAFYKNTVEIPAEQRRKLQAGATQAGAVSEVAFTTGQMIGDLPTIMLTSGILPELKTGIQFVNAMRHGAAAMTVPAMRAGADAAEESKKKGGDALQQLGAFTKATMMGMGMGAVPMATTSGAPTMAGRFAERAAKSVPLASATAEGARLTENLLSSLTGGEQRPFSLEENIKATIPMAILGGAAGRDTRPSKFERTYGFSERNLDKAEWMRGQMMAEGLAKATPEKVIEWESKWKEQEGQWPEPEGEIVLAPAEAPAPKAPLPRIPHDFLQTKLGIVANPKATEGFTQAAEEAKAISDYLNQHDLHFGRAGLGQWEAQHREAWHGTQADIEEFSHEAMGTGTGGQVQGYGSYVASTKGTGKYYQQVTAKGVAPAPDKLAQYYQPGKIVEGYGGPDRVVSFRQGKGYDWAVEVIRQTSKPDGTFEDARGERPRIHSTPPSNQALAKAGIELGNLYKVKVVGDEANYLDWDKPFNKQSEDVREALGTTVKEMLRGGERLTILEERLSKVTEDLKRYANKEYAAELTPEAQKSLIDSASSYYHELRKEIAKVKAGPTGEDIYKYLEHKFGIDPATGELGGRGDQRASEWLYKQGVIGNRYLDAESRYPVILQNDNTGKWFAATKDPNKLGKVKEYDTRQEALDRAMEEGTSNYVVFNPKNIRITDKNGNPVQAIRPSPQALGIVASPKATKGFEQAKEEAKSIADYLNKAAHWSPWSSALGNWVAADQKAYDNAVMNQREAWLKAAPDAEARKGMTMYREAGGDIKKLAGWGANVSQAEAKAAYRAAGALRPNELAVVKAGTKRLEEVRMLLNANGIDVAERENYITHMLHTRGVHAGSTSPLKSLSSFFKYAKARTYDNFFQAFKADEKPKTLDFVDIVTAYELDGMRAVNKKRFVDRLKFGQARDGRNILAPSSIRNTPEGEGYQKIPAPGLEGLVVHPDHYKDLKKILEPSRIQEWLDERTKNPFLNIAKGVLSTALEAQKYGKGTMFSLSFFHQGTEGLHGFGHRVNSFDLNTRKIDLNDPKQYDAAVHGLMLRPDQISQEHFMEGIGSDSYNIVTRMSRKFGGDAGKAVADLIDGYSRYLFESYIPRLKFDTYEHIVARNTARFAKELKAGDVSMSDVKSLSADQANAAYGHLNYKKMARSATVRQAMQIILLAPDFFEARARFAGQAAKGLASKQGTEQLIALTLLGVGQYVTARILNQIDHGDAEWDPEHAFQVKTDLGGFLPDKRWLGLRSVPEDIHKAGIVSLAMLDPKKAIDEFGQFMSNRLSPFARLGAENLFKTDWKGNRTDFEKSIRDMISNVVPLPAQGVTGPLLRPDQAKSISWWETLLKSTGVQIHRVSPINDAFQMAEDWNKINDRETYERNQASRYPESKYRKLRYALEDSDEAGAVAEAEKLGEGRKVGENFQQSTLRPFTGSMAHDALMYKELSEHDKKIFDAAVERRLMILDRYRKWVGPTGKTRVTKATLHKKMREARLREMKESLKR